jgi:UDP-N-acetyl-D-mannosaminuronate dehydrogenase
MRTTVIGLGEVGSQTYEELHRLDADVTGVDIDPAVLDKYTSAGYKVQNTIPESDHYIVAVYTTQQVFDVLNNIEGERPLVTLESTVAPQVTPKLKDWALEQEVDLVAFPHRFNPNDPDHHVFNLNRVIGGVSDAALERAIDFYTQYMPREYLHPVSFESAMVIKPMENAYRHIEIVIAQEIKRACEQEGLDYQEIIAGMNTKWNIDVREPRDGVKGKCLPKDIELIANSFPNILLFQNIIETNKFYIKEEERKAEEKEQLLLFK